MLVARDHYVLQTDHLGCGPLMSEQDRPVYGGRYEIVRRIARGGMADVYLARDQLLDRRVALKMLFPELSTDEAFVERFRREAQAAANLSHPNIVSVYDWGEEAGTYFIVMEFVNGKPLSQIIKTEGALLPDRAADIGAEVAAALGFAHRNGVVHRDVKPGNVLIDGEGRVKVADFGIARALTSTTGESLTQTGAVMGTATYFSPEQAQGYGVDARSDIYSLGIVLYEMVTGRPPFSGDNPVTVAYKHVRELPVPPRDANPAIPPAFEAIVLQAMAKDPGQRYQTAEELRADLLRFRQGRQVAAVPPPPPTALVTEAVAATQAVTTVGPATTVAGAAGTGAEPPNKRTGMYVVLLFVMLIGLAALLFALAKMAGIGGGGGSKTAQVTVPNVVGRTADAAESTLKGMGFTVSQDFQANGADKNIVFDQDPKPDSKAAKGSTVTLKVSQGQAPVRVPRVTGLKQQDAEDTLTGAGFKVGAIDQQNSDSVPSGIVMTQDPKAGDQAPQGATVNLVVSSGKEQVSIPDEAGKDADAAANDLGRVGLQTTTTQEASGSVPSGKVIRTDPPKGTQVDKGSMVTLVVSTGPKQVAVPDVVGLTQADATKKLHDAGFVVQSQNQPTANSADDGRVVDQNPDAGQTEPQGSTVTIYVGQSPTSSTTSTT
jgi:serine/threonine-protein kinase